MELSTGGEHVEKAIGESPPALESRNGDAIIYKRILIRDGKLVGFMLLGDRREAGALCRLMNLQGDAAIIEPIKHKLFDIRFLFSYVDAQERQHAPRVKSTLFFPSALPASVAATVNRRAASRPSLPDAAINPITAPGRSGTGDEIQVGNLIGSTHDDEDYDLIYALSNLKVTRLHRHRFYSFELP